MQDGTSSQKIIKSEERMNDCPVPTQPERLWEIKNGCGPAKRLTHSFLRGSFLPPN